MKIIGTILVGCLIVGYCSIQQSDERHVLLDGQPNFRDIGGYKTTDDKTVKWRQVYRSGDRVDMANINAFYILQPAYIDASLDEAVKQYGSMENYIRDGLGITKEEIKHLRDSLLER